jgi:parvulin-like peptidyl-prolyl isomerase
LVTWPALAGFSTPGKAKEYNNILKNVDAKKMIKTFVRQSRVIFFSAIFLIVACDNIDFFSRPYVAEVNGAKIYLDEYQTRLNQRKMMLTKDILTNNNAMSHLEEEVLDNMITDKIIYLRAQELKVSVNSAELEERVNEIKKEYGDGFQDLLTKEKIGSDEWREDLKKEMLFAKLVAVDVNAKVHVSEDEAEDYFNEHPEKYKAELQVHVAQIVVRELAEARRVLQRLNAGEDFARVAGEESIGPERSRGGDLGFITRQIMPEPLDKTIFNLPVNKVSRIVQSPYGFHIFKVLEIKSAKVQDFAGNKQEVLAELRAKKEEAAFSGWLESLKMKAIIKKERAVIRNKISH